jgi:hypothetical protein
MNLYGRWRPRVFDDVIGQAPVVTTLRNALRHNRLALLRCVLGTPPAAISTPAVAVTQVAPSPAAAPAPAVTPPAAARPTYPAAPALPEEQRTLAGLIDHWQPAVLAPLRRLDRQAEGLLRSCRPAALADGKLMLVTRYEFHLRKLSQPGVLDAVARVVTAALDAPHRVEVCLEGAWQVRCQADGLDLPLDLVDRIADDPLAHEIVALGGVLRGWATLSR